jgi:hypothetical protein
MSKPAERATMPTPELLALLAKGDVTIERFASTEPGRAEVQLAGADGRTCHVTVADPS